ncbi:mitochondrial tRNA-specific 2-thiouridylase 1-like [Pyrus ussuriensis x Pyrus communis]|uniref:Mitochondrial tRNA-specific 2-thiouridylase 1-like n=1 Tax=Pyrus ussuriensis x Pyrus communis TaxID=2448454 RepID=A0A5N5HZT4_9ROSA|nr:mitochondrial tRNA-specific 2-thiouridylase 1-like [Pyrus ussuriensis x Pyrus communis]
MAATVRNCSLQTSPSGHGEQIVGIGALDVDSKFHERLHPFKMKDSKHIHLVGDNGGVPSGIMLGFSPQCYSGISILGGNSRAAEAHQPSNPRPRHQPLNPRPRGVMQEHLTIRVGRRSVRLDELLGSCLGYHMIT